MRASTPTTWLDLWALWSVLTCVVFNSNWIWLAVGKSLKFMGIDLSFVENIKIIVWSVARSDYDLKGVRDNYALFFSSMLILEPLPSLLSTHSPVLRGKSFAGMSRMVVAFEFFLHCAAEFALNSIATKVMLADCKRPSCWPGSNLISLKGF